jgi:hypothetical protein
MPGTGVQTQPGDALSCIKYTKSLQGSTVRVRAQVRTASGDLLEDERDIVLPDNRPTSTATLTGVPTVTPTPSPTVPGTPTPAAAHLRIALFVDQASDNLDGTLSSVISVLVTDATGATIGNGVPVHFDLEHPVPDGASVTSPGLQAAIQVPRFRAVSIAGRALPGKYDRVRQGEMVIIRATVPAASGSSPAHRRSSCLTCARPRR